MNFVLVLQPVLTKLLAAGLAFLEGIVVDWLTS